MAKLERFTWLSNAPWVASGYGQQTRINVTRLANQATGRIAGVICGPGLQGGVIQFSPNVLCFPAPGSPYGTDVAMPITMRSGGQVMFSLQDTWIIDAENYPPEMRWIPWFPVDHDPMPALVRRKLNSAWKRIAMSKYGVAEANRAGLDCMYVPHSVETGILRPADKVEMKKLIGLPPDKYVVGIVGMNKGNPSRKNFVEQITAFAKFHREHPDTILFLQTAMGGPGAGDMVNIPALCDQLELRGGEDFLFCDSYFQMIGFPPEYFAQLYNALDVLLMVTAGEGFGIPTIEAQACGCPVIGGDWCATSELVFSGRLISKKDAEPFYSFQESYLYKPHVSAIVNALEEEYHHPSPPQVEKIQAEYDADAVYQRYWLPVIAEIEAAL